MQDFSQKLNRLNEMTFYVYYGPRSSGKSSLIRTLEPPENGITIMYKFYLIKGYLQRQLKQMKIFMKD